MHANTEYKSCCIPSFRTHFRMRTVICYFDYYERQLLCKNYLNRNLNDSGKVSILHACIKRLDFTILLAYLCVHTHLTIPQEKKYRILLSKTLAFSLLWLVARHLCVQKAVFNTEFKSKVTSCAFNKCCWSPFFCMMQRSRRWCDCKYMDVKSLKDGDTKGVIIFVVIVFLFIHSFTRMLACLLT